MNKNFHIVSLNDWWAEGTYTTLNETRNRHEIIKSSSAVYLTVY